MIIIVDTNIVFSALLNPQSNIGKILLNDDFENYFVSVSFLKIEIESHWKKLIEISKLSEKSISISKEKIYERIKFFNEDYISTNCYDEAKKITQEVDFNDVLFVALSLSLNGILWTGGKKLLKGLEKNGFKNIISTFELQKLI